MTRTVCGPGVWTDIPDTGGDMLLEARGMGFYVDTSGAKPADLGATIAMPSNGSMVIAAGTPVAVRPAQSVSPVVAISNPV